MSSAVQGDPQSASPSRAPQAEHRQGAALPEQLVAGFVATLVCWVADLVLSFPSDAPLSVRTVAALHLLALTLPVGIVVGVVMGGVVATMRRATWLSELTGRLGSPRRWFAKDPAGVSVMIAWLVAALLAFGAAIAWQRLVPSVAASEGFQRFLTGAGAALMVVVLPFAVGLLSVPLRIVLARIGRASSMAATVALVAIIAVAALAKQHAAVGLILETSLWRTYVLPVLVPSAYILSAILARLFQHRLGTRRMTAVAGGLLAVAALAYVTSAFTYGRYYRVRSLVESRSLWGGVLLRASARAFDRDGDGYARVFGGGDCDDSRRDVHPGAVDMPGDGIDADCFDGDGAKIVGGLGAGAMVRPPAFAQKPNFIFITIDALRADHLGAYGYRKATSPRIDAIARDAVRFANPVAPSSRTVVSMPAIMTGLYPSQVARGTEFFYPALLSTNITLAEYLKEAGYNTSGVAGTQFFGRIPGYWQGFDEVRQVTVTHAPRGWTVQNALSEIDRLTTRGAPFFLWVHFFNVHADYLRDGLPSRFGDDLAGKYDTEISIVDAEVGRLVERLRERGQWDRTIFVLTSDHGEALGEHDRWFHEALQEEELFSPLIIRIPGQRPSVVRGSVSTIDVMPTILNLAGATTRRPIAGRSLLPYMTQGRTPAPDRLIFSERLPDGFATTYLQAIRRGPLKLILDMWSGGISMFDLHADPREDVDIADDRPDERRELVGTLRAWAAQTSTPDARTENVVRANLLPHPPTAMTGRVDATYANSIQLLGYDLPSRQYAHGETMRLRLYFKCVHAYEHDLMISLQFRTAAAVPSIEWFNESNFHVPVLARYPVWQWKAGQIIRDPVDIPIPNAVPSGTTFQVIAAVTESGAPIEYETSGGGRGTEISIGEITVR